MASKFFKTLIYVILSILGIIIILLQPYNMYCIANKSCYPISFKDFAISKKEGKKISIIFETSSIDEKITISPLYKEKIFIAGSKIKNLFTITNNKNQGVNINIRYEAFPKVANQFLERIECLCMKEFRLKSKETIKSPVYIKINKNIENIKDLEKIYIKYEVLPL